MSALVGLLKGRSSSARDAAGDKEGSPTNGLSVDRSGHSARGRLRFADQLEQDDGKGAASLQQPMSQRQQAPTAAPPAAHRASSGPASGGTSTSMRVSLINLNDSGPIRGASGDDPRSIWEAAERGQTGFIVRLVERNIDYNINQRDKLLRTALHWAAECNHKDTVECLLDYNADVRIPECNGRTAIHLASRAGHAEVLTALLEPLSVEERDQLCNQADLYGITPVYMAVQKGEEGRAVFAVLVENGGRYNQNPSSGSALSRSTSEATRLSAAPGTSAYEAHV